MKLFVFVLLVPVVAMVGGGACVPIFDFGSSTPPPGRTLATAIIHPSENREVPVGTRVRVEWTAANLTNQVGIATVFVRKLDELSETILDGGVVLTTTGITRSVDWDTFGFPHGEYTIAMRIEAGAEQATSTAAGTITINAAPTFTFLAPASDVNFGDEPADPNDPDAAPTLEISWEASDPDNEAEAVILLDSDADHDNGNEVEIETVTLSSATALQVDRFVWDGKSAAGTDVDAGRYFIIARVSDGVNEELVVQAPGRVTMPEPQEEEEPTVLAVTQPAEDVAFLVGEEPLTIEFTFPPDEGDDILIDLKIDRDDDHQNGNEITILAQRLIEAGETLDTYEWNGKSTADEDVPGGIYRVFMVVDRGSGQPSVIEAEGLVLRKYNPAAPLISLLAPATHQTVTAGAFVRISWRDDDPSETANIRLTLDDDGIPNEAVETGEPEVEILANRSANPDGVQDTYSYQIPASLAPGRYTIFAYIDRDGEAPFDNIAIAAGQIVIEDPDAP